MNFFRHRPLMCAAFSYLSALALSCAVPDDIRFIYVSIVISIGIIAVISVLLIKSIRRLTPKRTVRLIITCIVLSMTASVLPIFMFNVKYSEFDHLDGQITRICATVTKIHREQSEYASFIAHVTEADGKEADFNINCFTNFSPQLSVGDIFVCDASLVNNRENNAYYSEMTLKRQNLLFETEINAEDHFEVVGEKRSLLMFFKKAGDNIGFKFDRTFSHDTSALAKALLLGDRHEFPDTVERDFRRSGTSHILALSGMHLTLIVGFLMFFLKFIIPNAKARFVTVAVVASFVILFTGMSASIMRAGLMVIYYQMGYLLRDRSDIITTLFAVVWLIVLFDPYAILDVGLILSFAATFGIALIMPTFSELSLKIFGNPFKQSIPVKLLRYCFDSVCMSFAAGIFVTLVSVFIFDTVSVLTVFTTLIFSPIIILFMLTSAFSVVLSGVPYLSPLLISISELLNDMICSAASYFSHLDYAAVSTNHLPIKVSAVLFLACFAVLVIRDAKISHFAIFALVFEIIFAVLFSVYILISPKNIHVSLITDDKNNGVVLSDRTHSTYIDISDGTSSMTTDISALLYEYCDTDLDVYMLTHFHYKHIATLRKFNGRTLIRKILLPEPVNDDDKSYAAEIEDMAARLDIELEYYNNSIFEINGVSIKALPYERSSKTAHPKTAFMLEKAEERIVYTGKYDKKCENYKSLMSMLGNADIHISGSHGPKSEPINYITPSGCRTYLLSAVTDERLIYLREKYLTPGIYEIAVFEENEVYDTPISERLVYITDHIYQRYFKLPSDRISALTR